MTRRWAAGDPAVTALAGTPRLVVALDFDGTASELVVEPMSARAVPAVRAQVDRLSALPDTVVAFVSGRSMADLRIIAEHDDESPVALAGSHGAQYWFPGAGTQDAPEPTDLAPREDLWAAARPIIDRYEGVALEEKAYGFGVHTRRVDAETERAVFADIDALVQERFPGWRRRAGDRILEFSSRHEGKDAAIGVLRERFEATGILFAGDDVTDEDALRALGAGDVGVRVGEGQSVATLRVDGPQQIAELLGALADERARRRE